MAWIESHQSLLNHPKTKALCRILGEPRAHVVGYLHCLWWWGLDYAQDGDLSKYPVEVIAEAAEIPGDSARAVEALWQAGFLDKNDDGTYRIHDWDDYAGALVRKRNTRRRANRERQADARERVADAIRRLEDRGDPVTLNSIVREAGCSKSTASRVVSEVRTPGTNTVSTGTNGAEPVRTWCGPGQTGTGTGVPTNQPTNRTEQPVPLRPTEGASPPVTLDGNRNVSESPSASARKRTKRVPAESPETQAVVRAIYDAMRDSGLTPSSSDWWPKARAQALKLSPAGREKAPQAVQWALNQHEPKRGIFVRDLSLCRFARVIDAYSAATNGRAVLTPEQRRVASMPFLGEEVVDTDCLPP